jgi:hypothetical protein
MSILAAWADRAAALRKRLSILLKLIRLKADAFDEVNYNRDLKSRFGHRRVSPDGGRILNDLRCKGLREIVFPPANQLSR